MTTKFDSADDGAEVRLIRFFNAYPEGAMRFVLGFWKPLEDYYRVLRSTGSVRAGVQHGDGQP